MNYEELRETGHQVGDVEGRVAAIRWWFQMPCGTVLEMEWMYKVSGMYVGCGVVCICVGLVCRSVWRFDDVRRDHMQATTRESLN